MRELSLVKTAGISGYYSKHDLVLQMMFYGDITPFRCARMMRIAEEAKAEKRKVLVLTENDFVDHLSTVGFTVYRPSEDGLVPEADVAVLLARIAAGEPVVVNTNQIDQPQKNELMRHLISGLANMPLQDFTLVVESTESFFPRRRSRGDTAGMDTMNNLLKRAKASGAQFAFAAESPEEVAVEISNSCGTPVVGLITNHKRVKAVAAMVDSQILKHSGEMYGVKALNPTDFYIYNRFTAPRQGTRQFELQIDTNIESLTRLHIVPQWLRDENLTCGFDPFDPSPGSRRTDEAHEKFVADLDQARADAADEPERIAANAGTAPTSGRIITPSKAHSNVIYMLPCPTPEKARAKRAVPSKPVISSAAARKRIQQAGILNPAAQYAYARTILNARDGKFSVPLDIRLTPNKIAQRVIADEPLRKAIAMGISMARRLSAGNTGAVSAAALATAFYQALRDDEPSALKFHDDLTYGMRVDTRTESGIKMETALQRLGEIEDINRRSEAQYQFMRSAWATWQNTSRKLSTAA